MTDGVGILIIDDEDHIRRITRRLLERAGHRVLETGNGASAIELLANDPDAVDVAVVDLSMPGMDGLETMKGLRDVSPGVALVLMSGYSDPGLASESDGVPPHTFLQKPFMGAQLLAAVDQAVAEG